MRFSGPVWEELVVVFDAQMSARYLGQNTTKIHGAARQTWQQ